MWVNRTKGLNINKVMIKSNFTLCYYQENKQKKVAFREILHATYDAINVNNGQGYHEAV